MAIKQFSIENTLKQKNKTDKNAEGFWKKYSLIKDYLADEYYEWIQANCPFYTNHGKQHIASVIESVNQLLEKESKSNKLSAFDHYLLLNTIVMHDADMVYGRSGHSENISKIIQNIRDKNDLFYEPSTSRLITELVKAHKGEKGLEIPQREQDITVNSHAYTVYPKSLAALVRFADEISENRSRISQAILNSNLLPKDNKIYWEYANCITATRAEPSRERVIISIEVDAEKAMEEYTSPKECQRYSRGGNINLIEYIVTRLQKMNNEMVYCAREFEKYVSIRQIEVRLILTTEGNRVKECENTLELSEIGIYKQGYPTINFFKRFFNQHPQWTPEKIKELTQV